MLRLGVGCNWRMKGGTTFRYGWPTDAGNGLVRMGLWNGDTTRGPLVRREDIEIA